MISQDHKKRGLNSEDARKVRQDGHDDARAFAQAIGMSADYQNDKQAKKDVVDPSGDTHSVKSGRVKWQIFLYGAERFAKDPGFTVMNGMGELLVACIKAFPEKYEDYLLDKVTYKINLQSPMQSLKNKLQDENRIKAFFAKSIFNGAEVNYLTIKHENKYHVFTREDILDVLAKNLIVENSKAKSPGQYDNQKVIFKYDGRNLAELEMRNDSNVHYRELRFNMMKVRAVNLFFEKIKKTSDYNELIAVYGRANKKFGKWKNSNIT